MLGRHKKTRVCLEKGSVCLSEEKLGSQNHFSTPKKTKKQQQQKRVVKLSILKLENEDKLKNIKLQKYDFKAGTTIIPGKVYTYNFWHLINDTLLYTLVYRWGESNTAVTAYTMYRHLQQYCSHPSI